jgi:hypothetical protein
MLRRSWLLVLLLLGVLIFPSNSSAQNTPPISIDVVAGYGDAFRSGDWFPITVTITNNAQDLSPAILEWAFANQNARQFFRQTIDLPRGSSKQVTFAGTTTSFSRNGELRLIDPNSGNVLLSQTVSLRHNDVYQYMIGFLSSDSGLLGRLQNQSFGANDPRSISTMALDPAHFPHDATLLFGLDTIVVHDINMGEWSQEQRDALRNWVQLGGKLIVSGGVAASQNMIGLEDLLPVQLGSLQSNSSLESLTSFSQRRNIAPPASSTTNQVSVREGAQILTDDQLVVEQRVGMGEVIFLAFDADVLQGWDAELNFWLNLLSLNQEFLRPFQNFELSMQSVDNAFSLPQLQLPGFFPLFCYIGLYIFAIGPLNYLVLRKLGRPNLAWATIPAVTLLFAVGTYGYGLLLRGTKPIVFQVSVLQGVEGGRNVYSRSTVGLFSPQRREFDVALPTQSFVKAENDFGFSSSISTVTWDDQATRLDNVLVDVSSINSYTVEKFIPSAIQVSSNVQIEDLEYNSDRILNGVIRGELTNTGSLRLKQAMIVGADSSCILGDLEPGQTVEIDCSMLKDNFPYNSGLDETETFKYNTILGSFFGQNWTFTNLNQITRDGIIDPSSAYLMGWVDEASIDVKINGSSADQVATSLYVIRLNGQ